ncbi:MAG: hypothetical protein A3D67_01910 [Candidatus Lloydbacteria bacterium RIFCSPHIGHO2_02_FULL_51_22]|uniref:Four helix bundle protein n=3 Tax=Candidatus Lloydiibacteriota TaxID=1817910 RepID=A0A1G2DCD4_9BACT|nr:MAG: hypothetical protein A3D67_01910 [Candidatus Lloydbacteria bacterium RIFCSPHIGHO2_02_FULL_51_22]OGZ15571.1 MAG: hypothetical protein A3J08_01260 [Candidatus Lloydbacteria bacterium RIFCSPLOWO2_02_FULL_51_11]OGZ16317.1 MAG: hypothetical protein A3G11_00280 [Candidatus Lloydbacteria bacterium RIFCSPLOWO2_12_FULL_51_9]
MLYVGGKDKKIESFIDLYAWKEAHILALLIYKMTEKFPEKEKFGLTNQMRRAVVSVTSNIAEGFSRSSAKDKQHFYTMARSSIAELQSQSLLARDLKYLGNDDFKQIADQSVIASKLIVGLIKSATNKK